MMTIKIERGKGMITTNEWNLYLKGLPLGKEIECPKMPLLFPFNDNGWKKFIYFTQITDHAGQELKS